MNVTRRYDVDSILRDIEQGDSYRRIAEKHGCSKPYVSGLARQHGLSKVGIPRPIRCSDKFVIEFDREWRKVTGWFNEQVFKEKETADEAEQVAAQR